MNVELTATPIFTDASGRRVTVLVWVARGLSACFVLVTGAVAFTFLTHVSLPGLGGLVGPQPAARPPSAAHGSVADGKGAFDAARRSLSDTSMAVDAAVRPGSRTGSVAAGETTTSPTTAVVRSSRPASTTSGSTATKPADTPPPAAEPATPTPPSAAPAPTPVKGANSQGTTRSGSANPDPGTPRTTDPDPNQHAVAGRAVGRTGEPTTAPPGRPN